MDQVVRQIYASTISTNLEEPGIALIATGGFGRKELFPYSDIDVLFLLADDHAEQHFRESIRACNQAMWDVGLRASPAIRAEADASGDAYPTNMNSAVNFKARSWGPVPGTTDCVLGPRGS